MSRRTTLRSGVLALLGCAALSACADRAPDPLAPSAPSLTASSTTPDDATRDLARLVAVALQDRGLRMRVRADMLKSPFRERKLSFSRYVHGESGGILLAKMAQHTGYDRAALLELIRRAPDLEFYMPVRAHRAAWKGGENLLVAAQVDEKSEPHGFTLTGDLVRLGLDAPPATPTLVLVPVETDFNTVPTRSADGGSTSVSLMSDDPMVGGEGTELYCPPTALDCGGQTYDPCAANPYEPGCPEDPCLIDPSSFECDNTPTTPALPPPPAWSPGIYMEQFKMSSDHEPWVRGSPEIEVHLLGTIYGQYADLAASESPSPILVYDPNAIRTNVPLDCSGEERSDTRYFNYNREGHEYNETILFAQPENFLVYERVESTRALNGGGPKLLLVERKVQAGAPYRIKIIERDDGNQCPQPLRRFRLEGKLEFTWVAGNIPIPTNISGWGLEDLVALFGGNNDPVASWTLNSLDEVEQLSWRSLPYAPDARVVVNNRGFNRWQIPPGYVTEHWPRAY